MELVYNRTVGNKFLEQWLYKELYASYLEARKGGKRKTVDGLKPEQLMQATI